MKLPIYLIIFACAFLNAAQAQLCTGSIGDAILHVDFSAGSGAGAALETGQTSYNYSNKRCPNENEYSLINFTFGCFQDSWHPLIGDHTPADQDGFYMLINSGNVKGEIFNRMLTGLCADTKYEFAAWAKNVVRKTACSGAGIDPELQFTVETPDGIILQSYTNTSLYKQTDATWEQMGTTFVLPAGVSTVRLKIINTAGNGCGNSLAIDDITVKPCGPEIRATISENGLTSVDVCQAFNTNFNLVAKAENYTNPVYQWQIREGQSWINIIGASSKSFQRRGSEAGVFEYRVVVSEAGRQASPQCRLGSNTITIHVLPPPFVQVTGYIYGCLDGEVILLASGATSYKWTGPNGFTSTQQRPILKKVQFQDSGLYRVTGITDFGCVNNDSTTLKVYPKATALVKNGTSICEGSSISLFAEGGNKYYWEPRATLNNENVAAPVATPLTDTRYHVRVTNEYGCTDTSSVQINVWKKPVADAGPDVKTRLGLAQNLKGSAQGSNVTWRWSPLPVEGTRGSLNPSVNPPQTTTYTLQVTSPHGCGTATDKVLVKVFDKLLIPNAFSPNGDGINDTWYIEPLEFFTNSTTEVYNRHGQLVYKIKGYSTPWKGDSNGKPLPSGTYYYVLDMGIANQPRLTGSVTIIR